MNSQWHTKKTDLDPKRDKTVMFCECCGNKFRRWDIEIVEPEPVVFEIDKLDPTIEYNFACPACVTELALVPLQSAHAQKFRDKNEKLRQALEPQTVH